MKGRRRKSLVRLGSYKPTTFRWWVVDNDDVDKIFNIRRFIFDEKYDKITDIFKDENISSELAMVIGCITESQKLINDAVNAQQEGGNVNMCKALEKLE